MILFGDHLGDGRIMKQWRNEEIAILRRLRERFLSRTPGADYWHSQKELTLYDITFAERIGWKWDAVLRELSRRGWQPKSERLHAVDGSEGAPRE